MNAVNRGRCRLDGSGQIRSWPGNVRRLPPVSRDCHPVLSCNRTPQLPVAAMWTARILTVLTCASLTLAQQTSQHAFSIGPSITDHESQILSVLSRIDDPVEAMIHLYPSTAQELAEPRLLELSNETAARWMTEGDKLRLRRAEVDFADLTWSQGIVAQDMSPSECRWVAFH